MTFAFLLDSFVYVIGNNANMLETIKVEGVWQNPRDIAEYTLHDDITPSYDPETEEYPISTSMLDLIKQAMLAQNMKPFIETPTDHTNNDRADFQSNQRR